MDQMQMAERALKEIKSERTINWNNDPFGRVGQYQRVFAILKARTEELVSQHDSSYKSLQAVTELSEKLVSDTARLSYASLEQVVQALLRLEHGQTRLSREDASILDTLQATVDNFKTICATSEHATADIALESERCMRLGDNASQFLDEMAAYMSSMNVESQGIFAVKNTNQRAWDEAANSHGDYQRHLNNAREDRDSFGTGFVSFFDGDVQRNADSNVRNAERNLQEIEQRIATRKRLTYIFYQLAMTARNTSAAIHVLQGRVKRVADEYDIDFRRITDELKAANLLWRGLMDLKNAIWATDLYTTRDNSLKVILDLLDMDDEVFHREPFFEETQIRIQDAISAKLGVNAVGLLKTGKFGPKILEDGSELLKL